MIDLHCHLFPGIDDGPASLDEALALARIAVANGIRRAVVTPHIHPGQYDNDILTIGAAWASFSAAVRQAGIGLEMAYAAEVRLDIEILPMIEAGRIPFLGEQDGYKILLLEFPHGNIPVGSEKLVRWLLDRKIRPLIAHPERNKDVMRAADRLAPFVSMGCWSQVTSGSLAGIFGPIVEERAIDLLEKGWVTLIASDAHNIELRIPALEPGRAVAARIVGEDESWAMVRSRPAAIAASKFIAPVDAGHPAL